MSHCHCSKLGVMAGRSRPKGGVVSLAYDPAIHAMAPPENNFTI